MGRLISEQPFPCLHPGDGGPARELTSPLVQSTVLRSPRGTWRSSSVPAPYLVYTADGGPVWGLDSASLLLHDCGLPSVGDYGLGDPAFSLSFSPITNTLIGGQRKRSGFYDSVEVFSAASSVLLRDGCSITQLRWALGCKHTEQEHDFEEDARSWGERVIKCLQVNIGCFFLRSAETMGRKEIAKKHKCELKPSGNKTNIILSTRKCLDVTNHVKASAQFSSLACMIPLGSKETRSRSRYQCTSWV